MATGTLDTFSENRDEIISNALANIGVIGPGKTATGLIRDFAAMRLNALVKSLDSDGQFLWRLAPLTFTTVAGTTAYALNATVLSVDAPISYLQVGGTARVPLDPMTRDEYMALSDRTTQSRVPSQYLITKALTGNGRTLSTMTLWPVPSTSLDTVEYQASVRAKDYETGANSSDFPTNWILCLTYGLSAELAPSFNALPMAQYYMPLFMAEKQKQLNADNETGNLQLVPYGRW